jgi:two-component system nitrogen regulation response regulator NtrX
MSQNKTVLLIDDEQAFLEPLADALEYEGFRVLKARTADHAIELLAKEQISLVTIDIMLDPGDKLGEHVDSHSTGLFLCRHIREKYPTIDAFCISVVSDTSTIVYIQSLGIRFLSKGETSLRTVLDMLRSKLTGIAYSTDRSRKNR